jgi:hypothetical protein
MSVMIILAAAALAADVPQMRVTATVQATATIRVIRAVRLKLDGSANDDAPPPRVTIIAAADGTQSAAKVIDFQ